MVFGYDVELVCTVVLELSGWPKGVRCAVCRGGTGAGLNPARSQQENVEWWIACEKVSGWIST